MKELLWCGLYSVILSGVFSCNSNKAEPSKELISTIKLKQGDLVLCSPADKQFGNVSFETSCSGSVKKDFDLAVALLHSFEYDEAEKAFAKVINAEPGCAMAYWGVAMANYHQVWPTLPSDAELEKGDKAGKIAKSLPGKSDRESAFINAIAVFYHNWKQKDHRTRSMEFMQAMGQVYTRYPDDKEAAIFYSLSLVGAADPSDKTYANQRKAGKILTDLYAKAPDHPGIVHYIIHAYDYPELASLALPAARRYASVAPSSAHAQHMPSHIFTRLGLWDESIQSDLASTESAKCYAENAGIKGHWDEELHGMDYLAYAYLQKADNQHARQQYEYLKTIQEVYPVNFKVAYSFAAIPARYFVENKMWKDAAGMTLIPSNFPWQKFPWQKAIFHFGKLLGDVHTHNLTGATAELDSMRVKHAILEKQKDDYKANQVMIQLKAGEAWIVFEKGNRDEGLKLMSDAAEMEDKTEKSPVTPGELIPARELMADMLMASGKFGDALNAYEADLRTHPNRFNALYGAAKASEKSGDNIKAKYYCQQLAKVIEPSGEIRPEIVAVRQYLDGGNTQF